MPHTPQSNIAVAGRGKPLVRAQSARPETMVIWFPNVNVVALHAEIFIDAVRAHITVSAGLPYETAIERNA